MSDEARRPKVMVVDDTPANLRVLRDLLQEEGFPVRAFPRGDQALKAARAEPPGLVLLDINMPEMDGFEVCEQLKQDPQLRDVPVIFISALTETTDKVRALQAGGVDYVTKPFQREEVLARVGVHVELRAARQELQDQNAVLQETLDQLKAAQSQLVQSEKLAAVGLLSAGVAHEINNPLNYINSSATTVRGMVEEIIDLCGVGSATQGDVVQASAEEIGELKSGLSELTANIVEGAQRAAEIVRGLRLFSRVDRDAPEAVEVNQLLDATLLLLTNRTKDRVTVKRAFGELPHLVCYPGKLNQVFMNLLVNALDAVEMTSGDSGWIEVRSSKEEREGQPWISISVIDSGPGIPEDVMSSLFQPFFTTKTVGKGTGLGLSISHGIVEEHGGLIEAANHEGGGARFTIWLPVHGQLNDGGDE